MTLKLKNSKIGEVQTKFENWSACFDKCPILAYTGSLDGRRA